MPEFNLVMLRDLPDSGLWRCLQVVLMMRFRSYLRIVYTTVAFMNNKRIDESDVSASVTSQEDCIPYSGMRFGCVDPPGDSCWCT